MLSAIADSVTVTDPEEEVSRLLAQLRTQFDGLDEREAARRLLLLAEGDRLSADARLIAGAVEVDMSPLTGESVPVTRSAERSQPALAPLEAEDLVFAGTLCTGGRFCSTRSPAVRSRCR